MNKELVDISFEPFLLSKEEWLKEVNDILLKLDICLCDSQGNYYSPYEILNELSEKWHFIQEDWENLNVKTT